MGCDIHTLSDFFVRSSVSNASTGFVRAPQAVEVATLIRVG